MLKKISLIFVLILTVKIAIAQETGTIEGIVKDSSNNSALGSASVSVVNVSDSKIAGGADTEENGRFIVTDIPFGNYRVEVTLIGYKTLVIPGITLSANSKNVKLGTIRLQSGEATTEEIDVRGEKSTIEFHGDKRILNVGENLNLKGSTALDVLKEVPGVNVDIEGNVSVRGSEGVKILIDGKPFGLEGESRTTTLEQLNADQIDRIELITNPSIKFDAEGSSGLINIILKKKRDYGYNGTISVNAGSNDKYSGGLNLNYMRNDVNLNAAYNYNKFDFLTERSNTRTYLRSDDYNTVSQDGSGLRRREAHNFRGGIDYSISKLSVIGFNINYRNGTGARNETTYSTEVDPNNNLVTEFYRKKTSDQEGTDLNATLNFSHRFKNNDQHKLTADLSFSKEPEIETTNSFDEDILPPNPTPQNIIESENEEDMNFQANLDYELPIGKDLKIEAGYKGTLKMNDEDYVNSELDYASNQYVVNDRLSNRFKYDEMVNGLYASISGNAFNFGYMVGGRLEKTNTTSELVTTGQGFDNNYLEFFPSVSLSRKLGMTQEIQASYSKRIRRPRSNNLNPFLEIDDRYNMSIGNPFLRPEFTNSFELNYINYLDIGTFTPSLFFRRTTDEITRVRTLIDSITTLTTFENLNSSNSYGAEFLISSQPWRSFGINGNISYFRTDVTDRSGLQEEHRSAYSWSTRLNTNITLPSDAAFQISYLYTGKRVTSQGTFDPLHSLDAAVKKDFFDDKLSLTLRISDILNSSRFRYNIEDPEFTESGYRSRGARTIFLNMSYKFGTDEKDKKKFRKSGDDKNNNIEDDRDFDY